MNLSSLIKTTEKEKRRLGRGYGSGRGKTAGRGTKGQRVREDIKFGFEGGQLPLIKRLPFKRGKDKFKRLGKKPYVINIKYLNLLPKDTVVDFETLVKYRIISEEIRIVGVKILGDGELDKPLMVKLPCSHQAEEKIKQAGGKVEITRIQTN